MKRQTTQWLGIGKIEAQKKTEEEDECCDGDEMVQTKAKGNDSDSLTDRKDEDVVAPVGPNASDRTSTVPVRLEGKARVLLECPKLHPARKNKKVQPESCGSVKTILRDDRPSEDDTGT